MTTRFEQDIDEQLREMFAVHKDYFDRKEREAQGRPEWREKFLTTLNQSTATPIPTLSRRDFPTNREQIIGMIVEMGARSMGEVSDD